MIQFKLSIANLGLYQIQIAGHANSNGYWQDAGGWYADKAKAIESANKWLAKKHIPAWLPPTALNGVGHNCPITDWMDDEDALLSTCCFGHHRCADTPNGPCQSEEYTARNSGI